MRDYAAPTCPAAAPGGVTQARSAPATDAKSFGENYRPGALIWCRILRSAARDRCEVRAAGRPFRGLRLRVLAAAMRQPTRSCRREKRLRPAAIRPRPDPCGIAP